MSKKFFSTISSLGSIAEGSFTGSSKASNNIDIDAKSETSFDDNAQQSWSERGAFFSRMSSSFSVSRDSSTVDDVMKNLYIDPDILEEKCKQSYIGDSNTRNKLDNQSLSSLTRHQSIDDSKGGILKTTKTPQDVINSLPEGFFEPNFDPVELQLKKISSVGDSDLTEKFMFLIEEADTDKDMVLSKLAQMIQESHSDLMACMRDVHNIDLDLARTGVQMINSRRKLASAEELLRTGCMRITRLHSFRTKLQGLEALLRGIQSVRDTYGNMENCINTGNTGAAAEAAYSILQMLQNETFEQIEAVQEYGVRALDKIPIIRQKADKALFHECSRKFISSEYGNIVSAYLLMDQMKDNMGIQLFNTYSTATKIDHVLYDSFGCIEGMALRIQRYIIADIDNCHRHALVEFIQKAASSSTSNSTSGKLNTSTNILGQVPITNGTSGAMATATADTTAAATSGPSRMISLTEMTETTLASLYTRITSETMVPCVIRVCEMLSEVVHTYYLIIQWHSSPFDPSNEDMMYLHRPTVSFGAEGQEGDDDWPEDDDEDDEGGDEGEAKEEPERTAVATGASTETTASAEQNSPNDPMPAPSQKAKVGLEAGRQQRFRVAQLVSVCGELRDGRRVIWEEILASLVDLLTALPAFASIPVEDFLCLIWALNSMIKLGKEFCGMASDSLVQCVHDKSVEYISQLHKECILLFQHMIQSETWHSVPVRVGELGGIIGISNTLSIVVAKFSY